MSNYYLGQIMLTGFDYAQRGFALCNGQLMAISQNQALYSLLGVTYGGNGSQTFGLPDLRGRTPVGQGASSLGGAYVMGTPAGTEQVTLTLEQLPRHNHGFAATTRPGAVAAPTTPAGTWATATIASGGTEDIYAPPTAGADVALLAASVTQTGNSLPHNNMQPFRVINFNIALTGIFPSRG